MLRLFGFFIMIVLFGLGFIVNNTRKEANREHRLTRKQSIIMDLIAFGCYVGAMISGFLFSRL